MVPTSLEGWTLGVIVELLRQGVRESDSFDRTTPLEKSDCGWRAARSPTALAAFWCSVSRTRQPVQQNSV